MTLEGSDGSDGAIESAGSLHVENSTLQENVTSFNGAAIGIQASGNQNYSFANLTFTNNVADGFGGAIYIRKVEPVSGDPTVTVQIDSVDFINNGKWVLAGTTETNNGGGLYLTGNLLYSPLEVSVTNSTFSGNYADSGGAVSANDSVDLTIQTSTLDNNDAKSQGGAIINRFGTMLIEHSTVSNNVANNPTSYGGGLNNFKGTITIRNSTFSGNQANRGGGFRNYTTDVITNDPGIIILDHVTMTNNIANADGFGGAIYNQQVGAIEGRVNVQNSLILGNSTPFSNLDCRNDGGTMESFGYNVKSGSALAGCSFSGTGPGDINALGATSTDINPTLANNGGPTRTHAIPFGSDARNVVPNGQNGCVATQLDQRGFLRNSGNGTVDCDAGSYEYGAAANPCQTTFALPPNQWRQISLPCDPGIDATVADVFGDDGLGIYGTDWALFSYDPATNTYIDPGLNGFVEQGIGYWLIHLTDSIKVLDLPFASTATPIAASFACNAGAAGCFTTPMATQNNAVQWSMIGYPFAVAENLGQTQVQTDTGTCATGNGCTLDQAESLGIVHNQLWTYDGVNAYLVLSSLDNLLPWTGYWGATLDQADGLTPKLQVPEP